MTGRCLSEDLAEKRGREDRRYTVRALLSLFGCLRTDTGTMTVGGGEFRVPAARACCKGGMVLQYSEGTLGFGLTPVGLIIRSRACATKGKFIR